MFIQQLRQICEPQGLHLVWPLSGERFAWADLLPNAQGAALVADGGRDFFERFLMSQALGGPTTLDSYTEAVFTKTVAQALTKQGFRAAFVFPFVGAKPTINFQELGRRIGLGPPGPLGIQVHPVFGPWWAYRALVVTDAPVLAEPPVGNGCENCPAPCITACHGTAAKLSGFDLGACLSTRVADARCASRCDARLACIRGPEYQYSTTQIRFHHQAPLCSAP